jgi:phospholipid/cholesterol/gamma-HCH transport system substrate-binding protein
MKRAIKNHLSDFIAILVLLVLALGVSGYIVTKERLKLPFVSQSTYAINAAFNTAQAFTPGQGQTVTISGVQIGLVGSVKLNDGVALVQLNIDKKYQNLIHQNATALARPRTGLQDMFVELTPGDRSAPIARPGFTIPTSQTLPEVNPDEVLASLDADTRQYLQLLVNGAGQGLSKHGGTQLAQVFQRFEPTHRDLARLNSAVAVRGHDLQQLVNSLRRLNQALVVKKVQIAQLVDASSKVFRAFASESGNLSRAVADLPGTLRQTTATLTEVQKFANVLGPAATNLLPAVRDIPGANRALITLAGPKATTCGTGPTQTTESSCAIVRDQIRPFVRASRPVVRDLRPAAINLAEPRTVASKPSNVQVGAATPNLGNVFTVVNHLFNQLGYNNEPSGQHNYLWWLAWLDHNARTLFSIQDANGDFRPLFLQANCNTYGQLLSLQPSAVAILSPVLTNLCHLP